MRRLRVGIAGFGYIGQLHFIACNQLPGIEVIAVADRQLDASRVPAGVAMFRDYRDMFSLDLDTVHICLPTSLHLEAACDALRAGYHVLIEKPIAANMAEAERMMNEARIAQRYLYTG